MISTNPELDTLSCEQTVEMLGRHEPLIPWAAKGPRGQHNAQHDSELNPLSAAQSVDL